MSSAKGEPLPIPWSTVVLDHFTLLDFLKGAKQGSYKNTEENTPSPLSAPSKDIYSIYHKWCNDDRLDRRLLLCYDHQVNA